MGKEEFSSLVPFITQEVLLMYSHISPYLLSLFVGTYFGFSQCGFGADVGGSDTEGKRWRP